MLGHALLLTFSLFGGLTFVEADLPGVWVSESTLTGQIRTNLHHADFDGDGASDVLTTRYVALQRDGAFPPEARFDLPVAQAESADGKDERPSCDLWGPELYLRHSGRLRVVRWAEGSWKERLNQPAEWPEETTSYLRNTSAAVRLERFLHDIDGDGTPEIVVPGQGGLHVYALEERRYVEVNVLDVFPPLETRPEREQGLWPAEARHIRLPVRSMWCGIVLNGNALSVIQRATALGNEAWAVRISRAKLEPANRFGPQSARWEHETVALSRLARPFSLNGDGVIDYVGYEDDVSRRGMLGGSYPIHETYASTDGGKTFQSFRVPGFRVGAPYTDFDSDGDLDLITEPTKMFQGGVRETVSRMMTRRSFEHEVHVHLQDAQGVFSRKPDVKGTFTIQCADTLFRDEATLSRYHNGDLLNVTADFDGDGYNDVLLQDQPSRLALFLNEGRGFTGKPAAVMVIRAEQEFKVADVDGDGRGDIVIAWVEQSKDDRESHDRVFLTRGDAP
jgi:hypothetical protein